MLVPEALVRQFYVAGSLRNSADGWGLEAQNPMGDGTITGVGPLSVDGETIPLEQVSAMVIVDPDLPEPPAPRPPGGAPMGEPVDAATIDRFRYVRFRRGERLRLEIRGAPLAPGEHDLSLRLIEVNLGALVLRIRDTVG